jgi:acetoin:2,6-dichlorophenolindophenol oxidoreductase subunit alpha
VVVVTAVLPPPEEGLSGGAPADWRQLLEAMWRIRCFEDEIRSLFFKGVVRGSTHLCQGQEAVAVGVCGALREGDKATCTYRGHGVVLAMGAPLDRAFGEILGRAGGLCGGKGGSMHLADLSVGALGSNAIVGGHLPMTVGVALANQYLGNSAVSVAFFGDGATNIGAFHESCNLAAVWRLPAIFVVENNHYGEYSPLASTTPIGRLAERAASYGMPGRYVDGNDVAAVRQIAREAVEWARAGEGPTLIEADTYRQQGHSRSDPATYRPAGELEAWIARDPITRLENQVEKEGLAEREELTQLAAGISAEVRKALETALTWPEPDAASRNEDVFA